jgi:SPOR domain
MSTPLGPILSEWEAEGYRLASEFDACAGAVVIGEHPTAAAEVALGIARVQARHRRVAIADTVGELGPLEDLVPMDAPYGLVDSFFYGVSLNKVAHTVDPARNLIIFPSGAVPIDHEALLGSDRWPKLLDAFRAADGLLLIVAPAESSALSSLIEAMDGVALVGNVAAAPGTRVLAHAHLPLTSNPSPPVPESPVASPTNGAEAPRPAPPARESFRDAFAAIEVSDFDDANELGEPAAPSAHAEQDTQRAAELRNQSIEAADRATATTNGSGSHERLDAEADQEPRLVAEEGPALVPPWARDGTLTATPTHVPVESAKTVTYWVAIIAGALVAAALLTWISSSMTSRRDVAGSFATKTDTARPESSVVAAAAPNVVATQADSAQGITDGTPPALTETILAPYSVVLADVGNMTGANTEVDQVSRRSFPAVTFSPYRRPDGNMSYIVISGAFEDSASADSLLRKVRAAKYRTARAAHVVRLPYAVLVQKGVTQDQAPMFVHAYQSKGLPVYALVQTDGTASLWAGAFRNPEQAQPLVTSFRANGDKPTVAIRTGRSF